MGEYNGGRKGGFKEFYQLVTFLIPNFNKFLANRALVSIIYEGLKLIPVYLLKIIIDDIFTQPILKKEIFLILGILITFILICPPARFISYKEESRCLCLSPHCLTG